MVDLLGVLPLVRHFKMQHSFCRIMPIVPGPEGVLFVGVEEVHGFYLPKHSTFRVTTIPSSKYHQLQVKFYCHAMPELVKQLTILMWWLVSVVASQHIST